MQPLTPRHLLSLREDERDRPKGSCRTSHFALRTSHFALRTPRALATRYRGTWWQILGKVENVVDVVDAADVGVGGRPHRCGSGITSRGGSLWGYYHHSATLHLAQPRLPAQLSLDYQPSSAQNTSPALPRLPAQSLGSAK